MERHGSTLAAAHRLAPQAGQDALLARLAANEGVLTGVRRELAAVLSVDHRISPGGEWLIDNFHLVEEQIDTAKRDLPRGYSRALPRLALGPSAGLPRVYDIALETISHGDGRVDLDSLGRFVAAYQSVSALKLGELWAIPIMLRLALIENLRRVGVQIAAGRVERDLANAWADRMMETAETDPKNLIVVIADMARSAPPMGSAFVAELARRLQGQSAALALALTWIEQRLAESHQTIDNLVQAENQLQASDQVSVSNSIGSLRALAATDWRDFVEAASVVDGILREDPHGSYGAMDFATRDRYRHVIERVAGEGRLTEAEVAREAVDMARRGAAARGGADRAAHVGFYLVDGGLLDLQRAAGIEASAMAALRRLGGRFPLALYLGAIAVLTAGGTAALAAQAARAGAGGPLLALVVALALLATSQVAVTIVNWLAALLVTPAWLPRMDFATGIPAQARTLVVVPTMLVSDQGIDDLLEDLEVRFLANRDAQLHFGLLTDFPDAAQESLPGDEPMLRRVAAGIDELNRRYRPEDHPGWAAGDAAVVHHGADGAPGTAFHLFHRPRRWNAQARRWMGRERKRGKLGDLNALLRGDPGGFSRIVGATPLLDGVRYVITLDTDTQLPRDAARQFVGAMAHPLNAPRFGEAGEDAGDDIVVAGYGILQPRVSASLPSTNGSRYARLFGGEPGIDPYTRTVSDVYQDVFGEGSFIGKGIYDVDAFERALKGRFPANRVLSHDLLEGCYARSGFLSDVELYEAFPGRYGADVARRRRWIRGDWQLLGWLRRQVRGPDGRRERNPLSLLSQWKLLDNLRRSLVAAALVLGLLLGWTLLPTSWPWTAVVAAVLLAPAVLTAFSDLARKPPDMTFAHHLAAAARFAWLRVLQASTTLALLPYEACFSLEAIARALGRTLVTHRRLLEWDPSSATEGDPQQQRSGDLAASFRAMAVAPGLAALATVAIAVVRPAALPMAAPILVLWAMSPVLAWWLGRPRARELSGLTHGQTRFLRMLARRTWTYFEAYVGAGDNWLPPDNVQEHPAAGVAHRTSPTNMGLALLANLAAHDFGYLSTGGLVTRTANALESMEGLERFRGHFYNWYDTRTRAPLAPRYVSTVDSGNLAGHLLTLRPGLAALRDAPILNRRWLEGLEDTLDVLVEVASERATSPMAGLERALRAADGDPPATLVEAWAAVERLAACAAEVDAHFADDAAGHAEGAAAWARSLAAQCADCRDELLFFAPWLSLPAAAVATAMEQDAKLPGRDGIPALRDIAAYHPESPPGAAPFDVADTAGESAGEAMRRLARQGAVRAAQRIAVIDDLASRAAAMATVDYDFLYDKVRRQLVIGYHVADGRPDAGHYDLLASEARLCNFVAIAQGALPQESWFALGRLLARTGGGPVLLSWGGSMFEYMMPLLVMPTYENTLLDRSYAAAVERQREYGRLRGVPWGMSESGYNAVDVNLNYQYRSFGVPGLGLKRGLGDDLVVAPYASALALMVEPEAACLNLQRLAADGLAGAHGLFEAVDYTPSRQRRGETATVVRSYMAHHQGMTFLACGHVVLGRPMQRRFASEPAFQATLLLLQERIPRVVQIETDAALPSDPRAPGGAAPMPVRVLTTPDTPFPEVQLLSNGRYHVMITNAGGGSSRWNDLAVTRWREDSTSDHWGTFCYLRDAASGEFWSAAHQPARRHAERYEATFSEGRAEFRRHDLDFETRTEIVVSPEDDIELRRMHITNRARVARTLDVTSYAEVVLAPAAADDLHPAFSNLFVQTEIVADRGAILCTRRPRSREEHVPWMFQLLTVQGAEAGDASFETDRVRFVGRGGSLEAPAAMREPGRLSDTDGSVLDPIAAIRRGLVIAAGATAIVDLVAGVAPTREAALHLVDKYQDRRLAERVFELTWTHSQVVLRQLNATEADSQLYTRLASSVIYANASMRAAPSVVAGNRRGQSGLWGYAVSGDLPIVLLKIADVANIDLVRQLVQAHAYWRLKGLAADLVIWNEDHDGYRQRLQEQIVGLIAAGVEANIVDRPGGIFVRHAEHISVEDRVLFESVARVIVTDRHGALSEQINRRTPTDVRPAALVPTRTRRAGGTVRVQAPRADLVFDNGTGGFSADGREYVIAPGPGKATPAPWSNVIANPGFGTVLTESGLGYSWSGNAQLFRLTPWHNDPVEASGGEALYLRDEESGHFWSVTPWPCGGAAPCVSRHGFGYSVFEHTEDDLRIELTVFVSSEAGVKFLVLKVGNHSGRPRRLSATAYVEWVLGDLRARTAMHVTTTIEAGSGTLYARNPYSADFPRHVAFLDADEAVRSATCDRTEFLGRNGTLRDPAALHRARLSGKAGSALDPCAALQVPFELAEGQEREIVFRLGAAADADAAAALVRRCRGPAFAREALEAVVAGWQRLLGAVQVQTPDPALDLLANGWLLYQTVASRLHARSGFYQSGGAYGFRDQLQDVMALVHAEPALARAQIALCASRQFVEGDVQHWWHPPSGRGVRSRCSDDYLWLPLATSRYVLATGDASILDEVVHFLEGRPVNAGDDSYFDLPARSERSASVYQHGVRAILHGLRFGARGLPLMGSGDWNDGMNLVGIHGKGESVWLAFFLCHVLAQFAQVARLHGDAAFAERCTTEAAQLRLRIDAAAWDGEWYRRAWFDDGTPLGSAANVECRIDSIAQSWSVLSGAGDAARSRQAMDAVYANLVGRDDGLVRLLAPPFDTSDLDPGYIRGYVPGVRENGGQYTHAAVWTAMAFAALGDRDRAWELAAMINPINHSRSAEAIANYRVEPYVVAADAYARAPHTGRGGWTWYTGSAGWMYRLLLESLLGVTLDAGRLRFTPCLPALWKGYALRYRHGGTFYQIEVHADATGSSVEPGTVSVVVDGVAQADGHVLLCDDRQAHRVEVRYRA